MTNHTIFEKKIQTTPKSQPGTLCGICSGLISKGEATVGPYDADGNLTFICNRHLRNSHQLISLLADYIVDEQRELTHRKQYNLGISEVTPDAWFLS